MGLRRDVLFGVRMIRKNPLLVVVVSLSLGLGIGLNTTVFSAVHALLLRGPAIERAEDLVNFYSEKAGVSDLNPNSYADFLDMRAGLESVDALVAYSFAMLNYERRGLPTLQIGSVVSDGYFALLETRPELGRLFRAEDFAAQAPVVIVTHRFWQEELGGEPGAIGSTVRLDERLYEVIGVLPESFIGFTRGLVTNIFVPITAMSNINPIGESVADDLPNGRNFRDWRGYRFLSVTGRLAAGFGVAQAEAEASVLAAALAEEFPESNESRGPALIETSRVRFDPDFDRILVPGAMVLFSLVGLVLVVACANVANLLLARAESRSGEVALRTAAGASRWEIVRQLLVESVLLGLIAGGCGLIVASIGIRLLGLIGVVLPIDPPVSLRIDAPVLLFTIGVSLATSLLFGLIPARHAGRLALVPALRSGGTMAGRRRRFRSSNLLVVLQVAVSLVLVVTAGLMFRSVYEARNVDFGFEIDRLGNVSVDVSTAQIAPDDREAAWRRIKNRVEALPGIESVALTTRLPFGANIITNGFFIPGYRENEVDPLVRVDTASVDVDYFETLGLELVSGRLIDGRDRADTQSVAVVTEAMARRFWPDDAAVGKRIRTLSRSGPETEIVGVVRDYKIRTPGEPPRPMLHLAWNERPRTFGILAYRSIGPADNMLEDVVAAVRAEAPGLLLLQSTTMAQMRDTILLPLRAGSAISTGLGALALFLSVLGLSGLIIFWVSRHRREIGLRMALGADRSSVLGLIVGRALSLIGVGVLVGGVGAFVLGRMLGPVLYVSVLDPVSLAVGVIVLLLAGALASVAPVRRATAIDPMRVLRQE